MAKIYYVGEAIKEVFTIIANKGTSRSTPAPIYSDVKTINECCFEMPVLAELSFTNELFNDEHGPIFFWNNSFSGAVMKLQMLIGGIFTDVDTLNNSSYGTAYPFGFFTNMYDENAIGYHLKWANVLGAFGSGKYRVKCTGTQIAGDPVILYSLDFCLKKYTPERADKSVRLSWWTNGNLGDKDNDRTKLDFGTINWFNQIRLPNSKFGNDTSTFERTYIKYQSGKEIWTKDTQIEEYLLRTGRFNNDLHRYIKIVILQADEISVTDYNIENAVKHQNRFVIPNSNYEPKWVDGSMFSSVEVKFQQAYQNLEHLRC